MVLMTSVLIALCVIIIGIAYLYFRYVYKTKPQPIQIPVVDFEKDIIFLEYLIKHKIKQHELFIFNPRQVTTAQFQGDEEFDKYRDQIVREVYSELSDSYKKTMSKYFNEDGLRIFIIEEVMKHLTAIMAGNNFSKVKKRNAEALTKAIFNKSEKNNKGK